MAKKDQKSQEKKVLTEWQKRNLEFLRKKETKDSEEMTNKTGVYPEKATSQENKIPVKKKVKKKKRKNNKAKVSLARDLEKQSNLSDYATGYHMVHCFFLRTYVWFAVGI